MAVQPTGVPSTDATPLRPATIENPVLNSPFVEPDRHFVVEDGQVSGRIDPYTDPVCDCQVKTEFLGLLKGDIVDGTFTTEMIEDGKTMRGNWSVARKGV